MKSNKSSAALRFRLVAVLVLASYSQLTLAQKGGLTSGQPGGDSIGDIYSDGPNGAKVGTLLFNSIAPYFNMQPLPMPGGDDEAIKKTFQNLGAGQSLSDAWSNAAKSAAGFEDSPKQPTSYAPPAPGSPSPPPPPVSTYSQQPMPTPDQIAPPPDPCQSGPCFKSADPGPDSQPQIQPNTQSAQPANGITPPPSAPVNQAPLQLTSASSAGSVDPQAAVAKFADDIDSHATQWAASSSASVNIGEQNSSEFRSSLADYFSSGNAADGLESGGADESYVSLTGGSVPSSLDTLTSSADTNTFPGPALHGTGSITAADLASIGADNTGSAAAPSSLAEDAAQLPTQLNVFDQQQAALELARQQQLARERAEQQRQAYLAAQEQQREEAQRQAEAQQEVVADSPPPKTSMSFGDYLSIASQVLSGIQARQGTSVRPQTPSTMMSSGACGGNLRLQQFTNCCDPRTGCGGTGQGGTVK